MLWRNNVSVLTKTLTVMLVLVCMTAEAQSEKTESELNQDIGVLVERLNTDILALDLLSEHIKNVEQMDRDVLVFRQDRD